MIITGKIKFIGIASAAIVSLIAVGTRITSAYHDLGLPEVATRYWVSAAVEKLRLAAEIDRKTLKDTQIDVLESRREAVDRDIFDQAQKLKLNHDNDVEWRLHEKQRYLKTLDDKLDDLRKKN